jgi:hydroxyacylglutathione hydrolase
MAEAVRPVVRRFPGGPFAENGYLVNCPNTRKGLIVDPGASVESILDQAKQDSVEVLSIVLTHAHLDHVDGVGAAKEATGAPIHLHRDDELLYRQAVTQATWLGLDMEPPPPLDEYLTDGEVFRFGDCQVEVRHTPGHSPGHVILVGNGVALVGDCVFSGSIGRTDLPGGNFQTLMSSIRDHILSLPDETVLYSGHGPETTVGHERVANPFLAPQFGGSSFA